MTWCSLLPLTHCPPHTQRPLVYPRKAGDSGLLFPPLSGMHTHTPSEMQPTRAGDSGGDSRAGFVRPPGPHWGLLTFTLDLKHTDSVLQREAAELTCWKCVSPLAARGLRGPRGQAQGLVF